MKKIFLICIIGFFLSGCFTTRVVLHPIEKSDIFSIEQGSKIITPDGEETLTEKSGWFLSDSYVEQVAKAKVGE